jgi:hypothetical protein
MQLSKVRANRAVAGRDHLNWLVQRLGDLPQRGRPVPALLAKLFGFVDRFDCIRE